MALDSWVEATLASAELLIAVALPALARPAEALEPLAEAAGVALRGLVVDRVEPAATLPVFATAIPRLSMLVLK